jgi:hypothetical protein
MSIFKSILNAAKSVNWKRDVLPVVVSAVITATAKAKAEKAAKDAIEARAK